jgi:uncharacterized protein DUF3649
MDPLKSIDTIARQFAMGNPLSSERASGDRFVLGVTSRVAAAIFGGYALAASSATFFAVFLPLTQVEATVAGTFLAIVMYVCAAMWAFAARSAWQAWLGLLAPAAIAMALVIISGRAA